MKKIAVVGTGIMGAGMVSNFLKNGYEVFVWNRSADKLKPLTDKGAVAVLSPKEAAEKADIVFEVTANDESSRQVWLQDNGILSGADKNKILVASATLSVAWMEELAKICADRGLRFLDIPLTGGRSGAENGKLIMLCGGEEALLNELKPDLAAVSEKVLYFGKAGSGAKFKLLLNMLQGIHVTALGEVLKIAAQSGIDVKAVGDALAERPGGTTTQLAWRAYLETPDPINFSVKWIAKDLTYAKLMSNGLRLPLLNDTLAKLNQAIEQGKGDEDWTIINKL